MSHKWAIFGKYSYNFQVHIRDHDNDYQYNNHDINTISKDLKTKLCWIHFIQNIQFFVKNKKIRDFFKFFVILQNYFDFLIRSITFNEIFYSQKVSLLNAYYMRNSWFTKQTDRQTVTGLRLLFIKYNFCIISRK